MGSPGPSIHSAGSLEITSRKDWIGNNSKLILKKILKIFSKNNLAPLVGRFVLNNLLVGRVLIFLILKFNLIFLIFLIVCASNSK
jgi:hypothetical protein